MGELKTERVRERQRKRKGKKRGDRQTEREMGKCSAKKCEIYDLMKGCTSLSLFAQRLSPQGQLKHFMAKWRGPQ